MSRRRDEEAALSCIRSQFDMEPRIETLPEKKLIGKRMTMSLANNKTGELWRNFMPRRREIQNNLTSELFSMQVYNGPLALGDHGSSDQPRNRTLRANMQYAE
jgi:hypothetical protein